MAKQAVGMESGFTVAPTFKSCFQSRLECGRAGLAQTVRLGESPLGVHKTCAAGGGFLAPSREGVPSVSGSRYSEPGGCRGKERSQAMIRVPRQTWWRDSDKISGSISAPFPDHGERKISVLDTDYTTYMIFCMEAPTPTDEHGAMCQCLCTWLTPGGVSGDVAFGQAVNKGRSRLPRTFLGPGGRRGRGAASLAPTGHASKGPSRGARHWPPDVG